MGAEQAKNMVSGSGAVSRCEIKLVGAGPRGHSESGRPWSGQRESQK